MTRPLPILPPELRQMPLFALLPDLQLQLLGSLMQRASFATSGVLMAVDEPTPHVYVMQSGTVKVCIVRSRDHAADDHAASDHKGADHEAIGREAEAERRDVTGGRAAEDGMAEEGSEHSENEGAESEGAERLGRTVVLNLCGPGDVLGEMSALDELGCSASVVALEPCKALWMEAGTFRDCVAQMPLLERTLFEVNRQRLRAATRQLYAHAALEVEGRLAVQLLLLAERYGQETNEGVLIPLRLYQSDLADMIASSRTRIWAAWSLLRAADCISPARYGRLIVHDRDKLASYCR